MACVDAFVIFYNFNQSLGYALAYTTGPSGEVAMELTWELSS